MVLIKVDKRVFVSGLKYRTIVMWQLLNYGIDFYLILTQTHIINIISIVFVR